MTVPGLATNLVLAAFDLDRTLIYSNSSAGDPDTLPVLRLVENYQGKPLSRMTETAWALLDDLMGQALVVPVTTRTQQQYERVLLPRTPEYALCGNGGVLLRNGYRDGDWDQWAHATAATSAPLRIISDLLNEVQDEPWTVLTRTAEDLFCYLVAQNRASIPDAWLARFTDEARAHGWAVSVQGRKVYAVPEGLSKESALRRLIEHITTQAGLPLLLAAGDSLLDADMLTFADEAIRPAHGELHDQNWAAHPDGMNVHVTKQSGALAGEEITAWALTRTQTHLRA